MRGHPSLARVAIPDLVKRLRGEIANLRGLRGVHPIAEKDFSLPIHGRFM
jgi:hypothetical protein